MTNYEDIPCSIYHNPQVGKIPHQPHVSEDVTPQKTVLPEARSSRKKSCLSAPNTRKETPDHPALHRKTVAFGKTVNVSQTVEVGLYIKFIVIFSFRATSRAAKKILLAQNQNRIMAENQENREDILKLIQEELAVARLEIQEENAKKQEEINEQNLKKMKEMMSSFFQQIVIANPPISQPEKEDTAPRPINKITLARQKIQKEGKIPPEALPILERRLQSDPMFRQKVDDVLAEAEYEVEHSSDRYSPPIPSAASAAVAYPPSPMYTGGANPSKMMRETYTVERSIMFDNGLESIDQRRQTTRWNDDRGGTGRYRTYSPEPALQSTYQPGNSISYYPSNSNQRPGREYEEQWHPDENVQDDLEERKAERERRIREKYSRK